MKIIFNNTLNFGAKLISKGSVPYHNPETKEHEYKQVSFVEFDRHNQSDYDAMLAVTDAWENHNIARRISGTASNIKNGYANKSRVFALTTQTDTFEKLDPDKVLGITGVQESNPYEIYLSDILVKPKNKNYNKVGTTIISKLKSIYDSIYLDAVDTKGVDVFYIVNDFKKVYGYTKRYSWNKYSDGYI